MSSVEGFYSLYVVKNGILFLIPLYEVSINQILQVNRQFEIFSDGNDYYEFNCYNAGDNFQIESQQVFNQLTIDFIGNY